MDKYIAALDLGSSSVKLAVAKIEDAGIKVIYSRQIESRSIRYSRLTKSLRTEIASLLEDVQQKKGIRINALNISYQRYPVVSFECKGEAHRTESSVEITVDEINELKEAASALGDSPSESKKLSVIGFSAQHFSLDDDWELTEEELIGMTGEDFSGDFKFFYGKTVDVNTLAASLDGFSIGDLNYVFTPTTYIGNIISAEEANNGIAVIDIGSQVSSISVFYDGALRNYHSIPFGGDVITRDIAKILALGAPLSEEIKKGFGGCDRVYMGENFDKKIRIQMDSERKQVTIEELTDYINARVKEIFDALLYFLEKDGDHRKIDAGIVLTGGSANLRGLYMWLKKYTNYTVRNASIINKSFIFENEDTDNVVDFCNLWCLLDDANKKEIYTYVNEQNEPVIPAATGDDEPQGNDDPEGDDEAINELFDKSSIETVEPAKTPKKTRSKTDSGKNRFTEKLTLFWGMGKEIINDIMETGQEPNNQEETK